MELSRSPATLQSPQIFQLPPTRWLVSRALLGHLFSLQLDLAWQQNSPSNYVSFPSLFEESKPRRLHTSGTGNVEADLPYWCTWGCQRGRDCLLHPIQSPPVMNSNLKACPAQHSSQNILFPSLSALQNAKHFLTTLGPTWINKVEDQKTQTLLL